MSFNYKLAILMMYSTIISISAVVGLTSILTSISNLPTTFAAILSLLFMISLIPVIFWIDQE